MQARSAATEEEYRHVNFYTLKDLSAKAEWIGINPDRIKLTIQGYISGHPYITIDDYINVIDELSKLNKADAYVLATSVQAYHISESGNACARWACLTSPEIRYAIQCFTREKFGLAGFFAGTPNTVQNCLITLYMLKWVVEHHPADPNIALINKLELS